MWHSSEQSEYSRERGRPLWTRTGKGKLAEECCSTQPPGAETKTRHSSWRCLYSAAWCGPSSLHLLVYTVSSALIRQKSKTCSGNCELWTALKKRQRTRHLSKDKERRNNLLITLRKLRSESAATRYLKKFQWFKSVFCSVDPSDGASSEVGYFVTAFDYIFQVSVLYITCYDYFDFLHFDPNIFNCYSLHSQNNLVT